MYYNYFVIDRRFVIVSLSIFLLFLFKLEFITEEQNERMRIIFGT